MRIIEVDTPSFTGRFLHPQETTDALIVKAQIGAKSILEQFKNYLKLSLVDRNQLEELEVLNDFEVRDVWEAFCTTPPTRLEIPNAVPAWL
jgi:hypothetical protein|tara:strand:+ start:994 stop:1266 length:273 start_codon:yes stop_codon:yes gene_type:complete